MYRKIFAKLFSIFMILSLLTNSALLLTGCNRQSKKETGYKVTQYSDLTGNQGTFYTILSPDNELIIIDGGWTGNESNVRQVIKEHNNTVDAWFITHPHQDHAGAFNKIYASPDGITIKKIYTSPIDYDKVMEIGEKWDDISIFDTFRALTSNDSNLNYLYRGDLFELFGLNILVLNSYDNKVIQNSNDLSNDGALALKISTSNESIILYSDVKWMDEVITEQFKEDLKCDYVQVAHHGNWAFPNEFYDLTEAKAAFFDAPAWIMTDANYPAYELADYIKNKGMQIYDFTTAPNSVYLN